MRRYWPLAIVIGLTQPSQAADVQVRLNGSLVEIHATAAPLQDVLARLAQQTGMKVVYDGAPPRTLVTLTLAGRTAPEAVLSLFEGLGVNYAMMQDRTGLRVDMLLVTGVSSPSSASSSAARAGAAAAPQTPPPEQRGRPQRPPVSEADADDEQEDDPNRPSPPPRGAGGANGPGQGGPGQLVSPFGGQIQPLTMPTPPPPAGTPPSPVPTPTPNSGRL